MSPSVGERTEILPLYPTPPDGTTDHTVGILWIMDPNPALSLCDRILQILDVDTHDFRILDPQILLCIEICWILDPLFGLRISLGSSKKEGVSTA